MATGYTHDVVTGELTDFSKFLMRCAHAFIVDLRDSGMDSPIPDEFPGDDSRRVKHLEEAELELEKLLQMSPDEKLALVKRQTAESVESAKREIREAREKRVRIEAMMDRVRAWNPPSEDHNGLKKFMLSQLKETENWDCDTRYHETIVDSAENPVDPEVKYQERLAFQRRVVEGARKDLQDARDRREQQKLWIRQLKESVASGGLEV